MTSASDQTFYWYDYETFGINSRADRPAQFAGIRTDLDLNPVAKGEILYAKPAEDYLPNPESCLLTGITPQLCEEKGLPESDFAQAVWSRLNQPGTVSIGYNSLGFDDEVNRFLFWRNFLDPYSHGYAGGTFSRLSAQLGRCGVAAFAGRTGRKSILRNIQRRRGAKAFASSWSS